MLRPNVKSGGEATHSGAQPRRHRRQRAFRLSLTMAAPLVLVITATFISLKATTPVHSVQTTSSALTTAPTPPDASPHAGGTPRKSGAGIARPAQREQIGLPPTTTEEERTAGTERDTGFEIDDIATTLSRLNLDNTGEIEVDQQARTVLEAAFLQPDKPMDEARFSDLRMLIEEGLGGDAGQQAAAVAERFYRYSNAYREVADTFGRHSGLHNLEADFEQLSHLRQTYLGKELSASLYGEEDALMRYTLQSMRIQTDDTLSPEQKQIRQEQLRKQVPTWLLGASRQAGTP